MTDDNEDSVAELQILLEDSADLSDEDKSLVSEARLAEELLDEQRNESTDLRAQLGELSVAEKIKAALLGNSNVRALLVFNPLRVIALAVLKNPRIQLKEVIEFSKSKNTPDFVLRAVSIKKEWMTDYSLKLAIVSNPKTPKDVALKWVKFIRKSDLKQIANSREVSSAVSTAAKKLYAQTMK